MTGVDLLSARHQFSSTGKVSDFISETRWEIGKWNIPSHPPPPHPCGWNCSRAQSFSLFLSLICGPKGMQLGLEISPWNVCVGRNILTGKQTQYYIWIFFKKRGWTDTFITTCFISAFICLGVTGVGSPWKCTSFFLLLLLLLFPIQFVSGDHLSITRRASVETGTSILQKQCKLNYRYAWTCGCNSAIWIEL